MTLLLNIETATEVCSVCISKDDQVIAIKEINELKSHSELLTVFIDELLQENKLNRNQLDGIVISDGPGSYTGLRIGASTAKGLAYALDIPLIKVCTLQALANGALKDANKNDLIVPMIDARRMEVYTASFNYELNQIHPINSIILNTFEAKERFKNQSIHFCGNGTKKCTNEFPTSDKINYSSQIETSSQNLVSIGFQKYKNKEFTDIAYYEPNYFKEWTGR